MYDSLHRFSIIKLIMGVIMTVLGILIAVLIADTNIDELKYIISVSSGCMLFIIGIGEIFDNIRDYVVIRYTNKIIKCLRKPDDFKHSRHILIPFWTWKGYRFYAINVPSCLEYKYEYFFNKIQEPITNIFTTSIQNGFAEFLYQKKSYELLIKIDKREFKNKEPLEQLQIIEQSVEEICKEILEMSVSAESIIESWDKNSEG